MFFFSYVNIFLDILWIIYFPTFPSMILWITFCFAHLWTFNDPHFMVHRLIDVRFDFSFFFVLYLFIVGGRPEEKETINLSYRRKGDYQFILLLLCPWGLVSLSFIFFQHPLIKHIVNPLEHCTHCQRRYMDSLA